MDARFPLFLASSPLSSFSQQHPHLCISSIFQHPLLPNDFFSFFLRQGNPGRRENRGCQQKVNGNRYARTKKKRFTPFLKENIFTSPLPHPPQKSVCLSVLKPIQTGIFSPFLSSSPPPIVLIKALLPSILLPPNSSERRSVKKEEGEIWALSRKKRKGLFLFRRRRRLRNFGTVKP